MIRRFVRWLCERTGRGQWYYRLAKPWSEDFPRFLRARGVRIGENTTFNPRAEFYWGDEHLVTIGRDCRISYCHFVTHTGSDKTLARLSGLHIDTRRPIVVGHRVQIGANAMIGAGVVIGDDCEIGFGAILRARDFPDGVPAGSVVLGTRPGSCARPPPIARRSCSSRSRTGRRHEVIVGGDLGPCFSSGRPSAADGGQGRLVTGAP